MSSNIIDSSWLIYTDHLYGTEDGRRAVIDSGKLDIEQYKYNNIFLPQIYNGDLLNSPLFDIDKAGNITPGNGKFKIELYSGTGNVDSGVSNNNEKVTPNDFVGTAFLEFFKGSIPKYFLRTQSDAKNTFLVSLAKPFKYDYYNPLYTDNGNVFYENLINTINETVIYNKALRPTTRQRIKLSDVSGTLSNSKSKILIGKLNPKTDINGYSTITFEAVADNGIDRVVCKIKGKPIKNGKYTYLESAEVIESNATSENLARITYQDEYNNIVSKGEVKFTVNRNHNDVQLFANAIRQELHDIGHFIHTAFRLTSDGYIAVIDGKPVLNTDVFRNEEELLNELYENYHYRGSLIKNGKFTGRLFTSIKLSTFINDKFRNYGQELFDEAFNFLGVDAEHNGLKILTDENGNYAGIQLSSKQEKLLLDKTAEAIEGIIYKTIKDVVKHKKLLESIGRYNVNDVIEFGLNYRLTYIAFDDIFEGNQKFYKDSRDFLKRAKELQMGGTPFGIADYSNITDEIIEIESGLDVNPVSVQTVANSTNEKDRRNVKLRNKFTAITIKNTIRTSDDIKELAKHLVATKQFTNEEVIDLLGIDENGNIVEGKQSGYLFTKTNDAQSYITLEEWIRRITAMGLLPKYRSLIDSLTGVKPLSKTDIKEFVQVQKNVYFDLAVNKKLGIEAPRQIKNAEFVLIPQFIKGTDLERVYNFMMENEIDQLNTKETSKAGKSNVLEIWDNDGVIKDGQFERLREQLNNQPEAKQWFSYNNLYRQQEVKQHVDASNKFGVQIKKKIIDNIDDNGPLGDLKREYFSICESNLKDSFDTISYLLNIDFNSDGEIKLDKKVLYDRLLEEGRRIGVSSNDIDFMTLDEFGDPLMPNWFNSFSKKLESISQSFVNSNITRQKLPGFHAAQVTNVGMYFSGKKDSKDSKVTTDKNTNRKLKYHPIVNGKAEAYIEVIIPRPSIFDGFTDEEIFAVGEDGKNMLERAGIDKIIGYRIPTESKGSMAIMKIVGFVGKEQGSTIIVPDDWVSQTGSDFDGNSVYAIMFNLIKTKDGIKKKEYISGTDTKSNIRRYRDYINNLTKTYTRKYKRFISTTDDLISYETLKRKLNEIIGNAIDDFNETNPRLLENKIKQLNEQARLLSEGNKKVLSYAEFVSLPIIEQNSTDRRNSRLLEVMMEIISSPEFIEENLTGSHFRDIISVRDDLRSDEVLEELNSRSTYDFFDQVRYRDEVMSGRILKAKSVNSDTFCSVCNTAKTFISDGVSVVYNITDDKMRKNIFEAYGDNVDILDGKSKNETNKVRIKHNRIGWSNNNRNVRGKYITVYTAQTTAHHLDAVKEGGIPNVDDLTFNAYKLFTNVGSDFETSISFIMQNGVTRIRESYQSSKSIFLPSFGFDYIGEAVRSLAGELGLEISSVTPISDVLTAIDTQYGELFRKEILSILGMSESEIKAFNFSGNMASIGERIPFNYTVYRNALKHLDIFSKDNANSETLNKLLDLAVMMQYAYMEKLGNNSFKYVSVTRTDKIGAAKTDFATRKMIQDAQNLLTDNFMYVLDENGNKINFIEAVYPGIDNLDTYIRGEENRKSVYPILDASMRYASVVSTKINELLFETKSPEFVRRVSDIAEILNTTLTEDLYNDFQSYIIKRAFLQCYSQDEIRRINGLGRKIEFSFNVKDINNPTKEEINEFEKLSPAQQVIWIKNHIQSGKGLIFDLLEVSLINKFNIRGSSSYQTIKCSTDGINQETALSLCAMTNAVDNELVKVALRGLVDYAAVVENFNIKRNSITRILSNKLIRESGILDAVDITKNTIPLKWANHFK